MSLWFFKCCVLRNVLFCKMLCFLKCWNVLWNVVVNVLFCEMSCFFKYWSVLWNVEMFSEMLSSFLNVVLMCFVKYHCGFWNVVKYHCVLTFRATVHFHVEFPISMLQVHFQFPRLPHVAMEYGVALRPHNTLSSPIQIHSWHQHF